MKHVLLPAGTDPVAPANSLVAQGWRAHRGFNAPEQPWDLSAEKYLAVGAVGSAEDAADALLLAVRGALLVVAVESDEPWVQNFRADLDRLAGAAPARTDRRVPLTTEQRQLFELLAQGHSIASAAEELFVSLRTANRRIAEARKTLGAGTTSEAVVAYMRLRDR
ncbi:MAG TPA: sigma factor-like helix-turn-helix DNA-binding protein [Mycobacteriales bacterium]|nr:sigma factor-like helix-turn-helix DNA-binding protein [Mycobacteriales bacterium]